MYRAGQPSPGARLLSVVSMVRPGKVAADIGCDHGKLAVYLALAGICPKVIASDIRPLPLSKARALVVQTGSGSIVECRLGDGLFTLQPGEAQDIIIAGVSGETIIEILQPHTWIKDADVQLIMVPTTRHDILRRWLMQNGFALQKEEPVQDQGRYYAVMSAAYTGNAIPEPDDLLCAVGLIPQSGKSAAAGYIEGRQKQVYNQLKGPMDAAQREALLALQKEMEKCKEYCQEK